MAEGSFLESIGGSLLASAEAMLVMHDLAIQVLGVLEDQRYLA
jgi:hypothetical protein